MIFLFICIRVQGPMRSFFTKLFFSKSSEKNFGSLIRIYEPVPSIDEVHDAEKMEAVPVII